MPAQNFAACAALSQSILEESGRIGPSSFVRGRHTSPWLSGLVIQKPWMDQMGRTIKNTIYERTAPTTTPAWQTVVTSDGASINSCLPPLSVIPFASTTQEFQLSHLALESVPICLEDIRASHDPVKAINSMTEQLMQNTNQVRIDRHRDEYLRLADHKIVVAPGLPEDDDAFPLTDPTSALTMGVLRKSRRRLNREASGTPPIATDGKGKNVYVVIAGGETIENLVVQDDKIRDDVRWSDRANELLGDLDFASFGGFIFMEDPFPPRYVGNGGSRARVPEYVADSTTLGNKLEVNPAYENGHYEVTFIFHPDVFISRVPDPKSQWGDITYGAQNYAGDFRWINKYDRNCNPDENIGYWRAVLAQASEPVFRQYGYAFLHLLCSPALNLTDCASGSGYVS